ncbi:GNAT family N-acetyltransferase [Streptomyces sp. NBC_01795]|nr:MULTISPECIES: GNAT family N-acetyltransferase [unclassified Streptomyces]WSA94243.1 GNAT family N-acetyltransferase [Streptomyces sp. NBC_01795]WSS13136.1 GNAT family N-acetyltransferase [Streptomyces sp. NBC_01186]
MTRTLVVAATDSHVELRLRPWQAGDAEALMLAHRDPELRRWLTDPLDSAAEARAWIGRQAEGWAAGTRLGFVVLEGERLTGQVVVRRGAESTVAQPEVGYWVAASARGRGVATRALEAVTTWALDPAGPLAEDSLALVHSVENDASCRVAERCRYPLSTVLPPAPPAYPAEGHLHMRRRELRVQSPRPQRRDLPSSSNSSAVGGMGAGARTDAR